MEVVVTSRCSIYVLTSAALFSGALTLVTLALAVSTDYWLFMEEPYNVPTDELAKLNLTDMGTIQTDIVLHLRSGLWNVCTINLKEGNRESCRTCCVFFTGFVQLGVSWNSLSLSLSVCLPACLPSCLPACLPACLPVCLPACLPVCLSVCLSLCLCLCL